MRDLQGKVAVVTGGGSGIGRATSVALAQQGVTVAIADLNKDSAQGAVDAITAAGGKGSAHGVDVSSEEAMRGLVDEVLTTHGQVDIVVNNAGVGVAPQATVDTSLERFRKVIDVNLWGVIHGSTLFLPHLLQRPAANLVNVASFAGLLGMMQMPAYSASKFGVRGLTESLQMEFAKGPLTVTLVCPGGTKTSLLANSPTVDENLKQKLTDNLNRSKQAASPETVAAAIVKGITHDRTRVLIGKDTKMIDKVVRHLPRRYPKLFAPQMAKMYKQTLG